MDDRASVIFLVGVVLTGVLQVLEVRTSQQRLRRAKAAPAPTITRGHLRLVSG